MVPTTRYTGSGQREVGDGFLVVGDQGAVLQVKSRSVESSTTDDEARAARWVDKNLRKAIKQGRGTLRAVASATVPVALRSVRSLDAPAERQAEFERALPSDVSAWPIIVVLELVGAPNMAANLAALAEQRQGAGVHAGALVMLTLGTGIGMGVVLGGRIYRGRGFAGEVGHVTAVADGAACACGRRGCWETLVSGSRLEEDARLVLGESATAADLVAAARQGDAAAIGRLEAAGSWLGWGIEMLVLVLDPDLVVIGGAAAEAGDLLLEPARRRLAATEGAAHRAGTPLVAGILGPDAGAIGAALAAAEEAQH